MDERACVDANTLAAFFGGGLGDQAHAVEEHLDRCADCRRTLAALAEGSLSTGSALADPATTASIGRYQLLGMLGRGAMGIVYLALDPTLGRHLAVKLVKAPERAGDSAERLLAEARAMARVRHPNVAAVYDAGEVTGALSDQLFIAIEYVDGPTLAGWLSERPRSWRDIVAMIIAVGRGVAAAHRAGIIHRDLKPANILIGRDGTPRVCDFGLASEGSERERTAVGTPAYMAPEQRAGTADARSDQFSLCVVLYQALHGRRPDEPGRERALPRRLERAIARGLAVDPAARFASVDALIDELANVMRGRARMLAMLGGAAAIAVATAVVAVIATRPASTTCEVADRLAGTWDDGVRSQLRSTMAASNAPFASATAERVIAQLDGYAAAWLDERRDACEDSQRGEQSDALLDRRIQCLDRRQADLVAIVSDLTERASDRAVLAKAIDAVSKLPAIERCRTADDIAVSSGTLDQARLYGLYRELARARTADDLGSYRASYNGALAVIAGAQSAGAPRIVADAQVVAGIASLDLGELARGDALLRDAANTAEASHADVTVATARIYRIKAAIDRSRVDDAREYLAAARAAIARIGKDAQLELMLATHEGVVYAREGKYKLARERFAEAVERASGSPERTATALNNLGNAQLSLGELKEASASYQRALTLRRGVFGDRHPVVASTRLNLAAVLSSSGEPARALDELTQSREILVGSLGVDHLKVANVDLEIAQAQLGLGHPREALAVVSEAIAREQRRGFDRPERAALIMVRGDALQALGDHAQAVTIYQQAITTGAEILGANHPQVAQTFNNLGNSLLALHRYREARAAFDRSLAIKAAANNGETPGMAASLAGLAEVELAEHLPERAAVLAERALKIVSAHGDDPQAIGQIQLILARALWESTPVAHPNRKRARELAEAAHTGFKQVGDQENAAEAAKWLAVHR